MRPRSATTASLVDVVEAIYGDLDAAPSAATWLSRVLATVRQVTPPNVGSVAYAYDISGPPASWVISYPTVGDESPPSLAEEVFQSFAHAPPDFRRGLFGALRPAGTYSGTMGALLTEQHEYGSESAARLGMADAIYVNATDPDGRGVLLAYNIERRLRLAPTQTRRLSMVAAHIAAARRLRVSGAREPDAIFDVTGRVAHVERGHEDALPRLTEQVRRVEQARERASGSGPADVLTAWRALVSGKYTLVGRFDSDGRRHVIAYANPPGVRDPRGLTPTEAAVAGWALRGHSQKLIAYELGLAVGTVGGLLARVFAKLRIRSRAELAERLAPPAEVARLAVHDEEVLVFSGPTAAPPEADLIALSEAERAVAYELVRGKTNADIARALGKSEHTVTNQVGSVFRKLRVGSRAELAARWTGAR
jgi:DNA-binding CsgD family transcriptional regulator